jgi:hypothetical protein
MLSRLSTKRYVGLNGAVVTSVGRAGGRMVKLRSTASTRSGFSAVLLLLLTEEGTKPGEARGGTGKVFANRSCSVVELVVL